MLRSLPALIFHESDLKPAHLLVWTFRAKESSRRGAVPSSEPTAMVLLTLMTKSEEKSKWSFKGPR